MSGRCPKSRWTARGRTWGSPFYMVVYIYSSSWHKQICYAPFMYFVKHCITLILDETPMGSELVLAPLVVLLGIHELGRNLPLVASRVWSVCVHRRLCLTSLLPLKLNFSKMQKKTNIPFLPLWPDILTCLSWSKL